MPGTELTPVLAPTLLDRLACRVEVGMTGTELDCAEAIYGIRFAADHRLLLSAGVPVGDGWPNWRDAEHGELRRRLDAPVQGALFDVEHNGFWHVGWGRAPEAVGESSSGDSASGKRLCVAGKDRGKSRESLSQTYP